MKKLNNRMVKKLNKVALDFAKLALFFLISFFVEQVVSHLLVGFDSAILEFALNELGNVLVVKFLIKLLLAIKCLRADHKDLTKK